MIPNWLGLRKYILLQKVTVQDGWAVEIRQRKSGKMANALYNVWVTPQNRLIYTMSLGCGLEVLPHCIYGLSTLGSKRGVSIHHTLPWGKMPRKLGSKIPMRRWTKRRSWILFWKSELVGVNHWSIIVFHSIILDDQFLQFEIANLVPNAGADGSGWRQTCPRNPRIQMIQHHRLMLTLLSGNANHEVKLSRNGPRSRGELCNWW